MTYERITLGHNIMLVTSEFQINRIAAPSLPTPPREYDSIYGEQLNNVLRLYFNRLDKILGQLVTNGTLGSEEDPFYVAINGTNTDAFGRLRVSNPYTLFDSQNRYQKDNQFDESTASGGTVTYSLNESTVNLNVTTTSSSEVVRQSYRVMPYQPGKGLLVLATFVMSAAQANLQQRVGYFNTENGVFFQKDGTTNSFVLRTNISGTPSDARTINQAAWNGDKLDGSGPSGIVLDTSKSQILWMDFEWLGVGSVRCGFIINGQYIVCHTFNNANDLNSVYMTTAILPVRYEIKATAAIASAATLKQICSTVISEAGYQQAHALQYARRTTSVVGFGTTFVPLVSIRLASDSLGAVVLPQDIQVLTQSADDFEIVLVKNPTLTGASYNTTTFTHVDYDVTATAMTGGTIVLHTYATGTNKINQPSFSPTGYNFDLQIGASLAGVSDVYTLAIRVLSGTGDAIGSLGFIDSTD